VTAAAAAVTAAARERVAGIAFLWPILTVLGFVALRRIEHLVWLGNRVGCVPPEHLVALGLDRVYCELVPVGTVGHPIPGDVDRRSVFGVLVTGGAPIYPGEFWCLIITRVAIDVLLVT
jgi:hypothetical protein